ncbi:transglycosylase family protein [Nakamurella sp. PAMC28650]|uniref:transglycosylase family protein n=1 Tax=Nakamurella sp. PAMC28650 TaxID=2762325 RepID=UPI00164CFD19|nr:transglycosylase family protein [Nakamurella sp. PAMC28650]QNK80948.1 transglycosylase family protein [Nakamurella sp. PAMC28650]
MHTNEQPTAELRTEKRARIRARLRRNRAVAGSISVLLAIGAVVMTFGSASALPSAGDWQKLRNCESSGNYATNTGNGYYGAYQFDLGTWQSVGGSGLPSDASPATQDALAYRLWQQRGWSPWTCAAIVGLPAGGSGGPAPVPVRAALARAVPKPVAIDQVGGVDRPYYDARSGRLVVSGWAADQNSSGHQSRVAISINGRTTNVTTGVVRPEVNRIRKLTGRHGFSFASPAQAGSYRVCVSVLPLGGTRTVALGCSRVQAPAVVFGDDLVYQSFGRVVVAAWAFDNAMPNHSVNVVTTINGVRHDATADRASGTVNRMLGISGRHGLREVYGLRTGRNTVCVQAQGVSGNRVKSLGCKVFNVALPVGGVSPVTVSGRTAKLSGFGYDPNASSVTTSMRLVLNRSVHVVPASLPGHEFTAAMILKKGANQLCVYAMGTVGVASRLLTCRTVTS